MTACELMTQLQGLNPDAEVQVLYEDSEWIFNGECSTQVSSPQWGAVEGVHVKDENTVRLYAQVEDLEIY